MAAGPFTHLVIVDGLLSYACVDENLKEIPGASARLPPAPLLPNGGYSNAVSYFVDLQMAGMCNGKERTITQMQELLTQTGWRLESVIQGKILNTSKVIAVAA